jgi:hypothetical protein
LYVHSFFNSELGMLNAECRNTTLGFAPYSAFIIPHSSFHIHHSAFILVLHQVVVP